MRLLNTETRRLEPKHFYEPNVPPYAILSHTWADGEVLFEDMDERERAEGKPGWRKIKLTCHYASNNEYKYAWIDTCCIDKRSSAELSEAINSMYSWYRNAVECFVMLSDYNDQNSSCRWFTRGWTLQELIASANGTWFFDDDFNYLGTKQALTPLISSITSIHEGVLYDASTVDSYSAAQKLS